MYAIHSHQSEIVPSPGTASDQFFVSLATTLANFAPGVRTFEAYIDRNYGVLTALDAALLHGLRLMCDAPGPSQRAIDPRSPPAGIQGICDLLAASDRATVFDVVRV